MKDEFRNPKIAFFLVNITLELIVVYYILNGSYFDRHTTAVLSHTTYVGDTITKISLLTNFILLVIVAFSNNNKLDREVYIWSFFFSLLLYAYIFLNTFDLSVAF